MSETMGLLELAERCEAATGADRRIDYEIGFHQRVHDVQRENWPFIMPGSKVDAKVPAYTGSLDAALTLAEPSWWFNTSAPLSPDAYGYSREDARRPRAGFEMIAAPYSVGARGATMALATCAASLRARHALALSKGSDV